MKARAPKRRKAPVRDVMPAEIPEASAPNTGPDKEPEADPIPEAIRRMLEAAYT